MKTFIPELNRVFCNEKHNKEWGHKIKNMFVVAEK